MNINISDRLVTFQKGKNVAGTYVLDDCFKPYFSTLNSPAGHNVVVVKPADHRHHKGLMFALRCADINFWEENPGTSQCGVQQILNTVKIPGGIRQDILWCCEDGTLETYHEKREITCSYDNSSFEWKWTTERKALRDHHLIKSEWAATLEDGRRINYHGLGIRLPWMWNYPWWDSFKEMRPGSKAEEWCGSTPRSITWVGEIDGHWAPPKVAVTISQNHKFSWYVMKGAFPFVSVGPSVASEFNVACGQIFSEMYAVSIADR